MDSAHLHNRTDPELLQANRRFYDPLWTDAHLVGARAL